MLLRPLRRTPMMLGGVGFKIGRDTARRAQRLAAASRAPARDVAAQLRDLKTLLDDGALTPEEFAAAKKKVLDG